LSGTVQKSEEGKKRSFGPPTEKPPAKRESDSVEEKRAGNVEQVPGSGGTTAGKAPEGEAEAEVPAWKIKHWKYKDRSAKSLERDKDFRDLKEDLQETRKIATTLVVRRLSTPDANGAEYEEITGFKRLTAALQVDPTMLVPIRIVDVDDLQALRIQRSENIGRSDPSAWDQAVLLKMVMQEKGITSRSEVAQLMGYRREQCSNLLSFVEKMPVDFVQSLSLTDLSFHALRTLINFVGSDSTSQFQERIDRIIEVADEINAQPDRAVKLIEKVEAQVLAEGRPTPTAPRKVSYRSDKGRSLSGTVDAKKAIFTVHQSALEVVSHEEVEQALLDLLKKKGLKLEKDEGKK
jgi:hypothetical protein